MKGVTNEELLKAVFCAKYFIYRATKEGLLFDPKKQILDSKVKTANQLKTLQRVCAKLLKDLNQPVKS